MKERLNSLKQRALTGWNGMRIVRLLLALLITVESLFTSEMLFAALGGFLALQAIFNYGCCGLDGCVTERTSAADPKNEVTVFEEIK